MTDNEIKNLLEQYLKGESNPTDRAAFESWFNKYAARSAGSSETTDFTAMRNRIWQGIGVQHKRTYRLFPAVRYAAAAAILLLGVFTWIYFSNIHRSSLKPLTANEIKPGGNKAILTLADGTEVDLTSTSGLVATKSNADVSISNNASNGVVTFNFTNSKPGGNSHNANTGVVNKITTPNGGRYKLLLSDGTSVTLNAASSIVFPSRFTDRTRSVTVVGEAYFEVAHDPDHPFKVNSNDQQITVKGTKFNLSAYPDEDQTTTLTEGRIVLTQPSTGNSLPLMPEQQSLLSKNGFEVRTVNVSEELAWISNKFIFSGTPIKEAMKQIARWYNIEVNYSSLPDTTITASISRSFTLSDVMKALSYAGYTFSYTKERRLEFQK